MDYDTFFKYLDKNEQKEAMIYKNSFIPNKLYNFRPLYDDNKTNIEKFDSLRERRIWLSSLEMLNDPFEYENFYLDPDSEKNPTALEELSKKIRNFKKLLSVACFTNDINNLPLWAHYANNHKGFCVEYTLGDDNDKICFKNNKSYPLPNDKDSIFPISYGIKRVNAHKVALNYMNSIFRDSGRPIFKDDRSQISYAMQMYLLGTLKHKTWRYENEYRLLWLENTENGTGKLFDMNPSGIYIGLNCCSQHKEELNSIAKQIKCSIFEAFIDRNTTDYNMNYRQIL